MSGPAGRAASALGERPHRERDMELKSKVPAGPIEQKWDTHRFEMKLAVPLSAPTGAYKFSWRINDPSGPFCGSSISLIT